MEIKIKLEGLDRVQKKLDRIQKDLPFVVAKSLTNTAQDVKAGLKGAMNRVFDRPTPFTLSSLFIKPATKSNLSATIGIKDRAGHYLAHHIKGGSREMKESEKKLGHWWVPGGNAQLNSFGNITLGRVRQTVKKEIPGVFMLQNRQSLSGRNWKVSKRKGTPTIRRRASDMPPGFWQKQGKRSVKYLMAFVKQPRYKARFHFYDITRNIVVERWNTNFSRNLQEVINR